MLKYLILLILFFSIAANVVAESKFIEYKKYLIPIVGAVDTTSPECVGLSASKPNVIYIDDMGELPASITSAAQAKTSEHPDPNGMQDLAIVLGFSDLVNLPVVGVGVPGKDMGQQYSDVENSDIRMAINIVNASRISEKPQVLAKQALRDKIIDFANCSTSTNKLILAVGGPWHDVSLAIDHVIDTPRDITSKIRVIGITGSNIVNSFHGNSNSSTTPSSAYANVVSKVDTLPVSQSQFVTAYTPSSAWPVARLNSFYSIGLSPLLGRARDSSGRPLNSLEPYKEFTDRQSGVVGDHLRIADFYTVAIATGIWNDSFLFNQTTVLNTVVKNALNYAANGN